MCLIYINYYYYYLLSTSALRSYISPCHSAYMWSFYKEDPTSSCRTVDGYFHLGELILFRKTFGTVSNHIRIITLWFHIYISVTNYFIQGS